MLVKVLVIAWALLVGGMIIAALIFKAYNSRRKKQAVETNIQILESEAKVWRRASPESRALKRVNDLWIEEGFDRQEYTAVYNNILKEERRKPSEDMSFHRELKKWKEIRENL